MLPILRMEVRFEQDVVLARQRARQVAEMLGFELQDQVRVATALSEIARNALQHAGGGSIEFTMETTPAPQLLIQVSDHGVGLEKLPGGPLGQVAPPPVSGVGIAGARRVMDRFEINSSPQGTAVLMGKNLPKRAPTLDTAQVTALIGQLARGAPRDVYQEFQAQNQELLRVLAELRKQQAELAEVNRELEETNRGVVALYAELEEQAESLRRAADQKSRLYASLSHEFRTPLNSILSLSRFLLDHLDGPLTSEQDKQVTLIRKSAQNLLDWVNDLLDIAKAEAGKLLVRAGSFNVGEMLSALRGMMRPLLSNTALNLTFEEPPFTLTAYSDDGKVSQILRNFISNALKFTESGEVRVAVVAGAGDTLVFSVSDTGIGIAPADQIRIFEEFMQVEGAQRRGAQGTGLGLPLSRRLAELLGGWVRVESAVGQGSTFSLTIPRVYQGPLEPAPPQPASQSPRPQLAARESSGAVLIIDDDEAARYSLKTMLTQYALSVMEASSGNDGLQLVRLHHPKAIFLDLSMPGMSGYEFLQSLKRDAATEGIPVVIHTSQMLDDQERSRLSSMAIDVIDKQLSASPSGADRLQEVLIRAGAIESSNRKEGQHV